MNNHSANPHVEAAGLVCRCGDPVPDAAPVCDECHEPICTPCRAARDEFDEDAVRHEVCWERVNERAYDRQVEDYYGSSAPQTFAEHAAACMRVK